MLALECRSRERDYGVRFPTADDGSSGSVWSNE
jgi:hypothetical protein